MKTTRHYSALVGSKLIRFTSKKTRDAFIADQIAHGRPAQAVPCRQSNRLLRGADIVTPKFRSAPGVR